MGLARLGRMPPVVPPTTTVLDAATLMTMHRVGAIAVLDERKPLGVFTERDLMTRVVAASRDPATTRVEEVMTRNVYSVPDNTSVAAAATVMRTNHFRHLPVVDENGEMVSMVALRYLLYALMDDLEAKVFDLEGFLMEDSRGG
jgi:CBS domain-containing protein